MGATTFSTLAEGKDVKQAFAKAREEAAYEYGHGGYTGTIAEKPGYVVIQNNPVTQEEADALASQLIERGDRRINDKWGDAGAIPVTLPTRKTQILGFAAGADDQATLVKAATDHLTTAKRLAKGEVVKSVWLQARNVHPRSRAFTGGQAIVEITKAGGAVVTEVPVEVKIKTTTGEPEWDQVNRLMTAEVSKKLKAGQRVTTITNQQVAARKFQRAVKATEGKAETRYVHMYGNHVTPWNEAWPSQAEARKAAAALVEGDPTRYANPELTVDVVGITRRASGEPVVQATRKLTEVTFTGTAQVVTPGARTQEIDAWLFFGWASE